MKRITMLLGTGILLLCSTVFAAVPQLINFQGILRDGSGNPVANGSYSVQFTIYDAPSGGNVIWQETQSVNTASGLFTVLLGSSSPVLDSIFNDSSRYLGIKVGADPEMTPRQRLSSVGYSQRSSEWTSAGPDLFRLSGNVGVGIAPLSNNRLRAANSGSDPAALIAFRGFGSNNSGNAFGGYFDGFASGGGDGYGAYGEGSTNGVWGNSANIGVRGTGETGVSGEGTNSGVSGNSVTGYGVAGSGGNTGVVGLGGPYGVSGNGTSYGVYGSSSNYGVYGAGGPIGGYFTASSGGSPTGVYASGSGYGVIGAGVGEGLHGSGRYGVVGVATTSTGAGVYGDDGGLGSAAAYFLGVVSVLGDYSGLGNLSVTGNLTKGSGSFKIDHPLDPTNKYLYHSFVESPDMMNIYNGNATLDAKGEATVQMPDWFGALNKDFRYQLTAIGAPGPNLYVAEEISENQFKISGGTAGMKVSWQVTGVRQDAFANAHRIPVEEEKTGKEKGKYLHPEEHGVAKTLGMYYEEEQKIAAERKKMKEEQTKMEAERKQHEEKRAKMEEERVRMNEKAKEIQPNK